MTARSGLTERRGGVKARTSWYTWPPRMPGLFGDVFGISVGEMLATSCGDFAASCGDVADPGGDVPGLSHVMGPTAATGPYTLCGGTCSGKRSLAPTATGHSRAITAIMCGGGVPLSGPLRRDEDAN